MFVVFVRSVDERDGVSVGRVVVVFDDDEEICEMMC